MFGPKSVNNSNQNNLAKKEKIGHIIQDAWGVINDTFDQTTLCLEWEPTESQNYV